MGDHEQVERGVPAGTEVGRSRAGASTPAAVARAGPSSSSPSCRRGPGVAVITTELCRRRGPPGRRAARSRRSARPRPHRRGDVGAIHADPRLPEHVTVRGQLDGGDRCGGRARPPLERDRVEATRSPAAGASRLPNTAAGGGIGDRPGRSSGPEHPHGDRIEPHAAWSPRGRRWHERHGRRVDRAEVERCDPAGARVALVPCGQRTSSRGTPATPRRPSARRARGRRRRRVALPGVPPRHLRQPVDGCPVRRLDEPLELREPSAFGSPAPGSDAAPARHEPRWGSRRPASAPSPMPARLAPRPPRPPPQAPRCHSMSGAEPGNVERDRATSVDVPAPLHADRRAVTPSTSLRSRPGDGRRPCRR